MGDYGRENVMIKKIDIKRLGKVLTEELTGVSELEYKAIAFELFGEIIKMTPVKTGRARGNWHINVSSPMYSTSFDTRPSQPDYNLDVRGFPSVYISNGLPYMGDLEDGRSDQAPDGISQVALAIVRSRR
jgi:hypothetical protein